MREKFIKLMNGSDEIYLDPQMISYVRHNPTYNSVTIYLFGGQMVVVKEDINEILKLIKRSNEFKFEL